MLRKKYIDLKSGCFCFLMVISLCMPAVSRNQKLGSKSETFEISQRYHKYFFLHTECRALKTLILQNVIILNLTRTAV